MIMKTNLVFERWEEIFKDSVLTGAIVDRLAHKAHVSDMSVPRFRLLKPSLVREPIAAKNSVSILTQFSVDIYNR